MTPILAVLTLVGILAIGWSFTRILPDLTSFVLGSDQGRDQTLDGFRGLLAISVVVHHCILARQTHATGRLFAPPGHLDSFLGGGAVAFFFMASAYLFCGKVLRSGGQLRTVDFTIGRIRRIVPLYVFAVFLVALITIAEAGFIVHQPAEFITDASKWLLFDFVTRPDLNGVDNIAGYLGMVWTLRYEWILYAALPLLAFAYRKTNAPIVIFIGLGLLAIKWRICIFFFAGAMTWYAGKFKGGRFDILLSGTALLCIALALWKVGDYSGIKAAILLTPLFVCVITGRSIIVRWLSTRPLKLLGQLSFSVYLLHVIVMNMVLKYIVGLNTFKSVSDISLMFIIIFIFIIVLAILLLTFIFIERPFLQIGKKAAIRENLIPIAQVP